MKNRLVVARNWRGMGPEGSGKKVKVAQSSPTLCDPMDDTPQCSSVYGLLQVIILEWVAISFSRGSSWPRNWTQVSCIIGRFFTMWATREPEKEVWGGGYKRARCGHLWWRKCCLDYVSVSILAVTRFCKMLRLGRNWGRVCGRYYNCIKFLLR